MQIQRQARTIPSAVIAVSLAGWFISCREDSAHLGAAGTLPSPTAGAALRNVQTPPQRQLTVPTGAFTSGTRAGSWSRRPEVEPPQSEVKLGEFRIDFEPFPNVIGQPPLLGISRDDASSRGAARGGRLCTELEWERACRGPKSAVFAGGNEFTCGSGPCISGFDVAGLGALPEWTASYFGEGSPLATLPVLRGAPLSAPAGDHRCAHRDSTKRVDAAQVAFRCCYGAPNAAQLAEPELGPAFQKRAFTGAQAKAWLQQDPITARLAEKLVLFASPESVHTVLGRGPGDRKGFDFTVDGLLWQPVAGAEYLVLTARSGEDTSFVVAFHSLGNDRFSLASSFVMEKEKGPIALAYSESIRPRLHFSSCWGCPGETGKVLFRAPDRAVILQP